jgi:large subunit ribosomal protein L14e
MIEVGRLCVKTAGRDAMEHCVVVEVIDEHYVLVDGNTRRKKVNKAHLEPTAKKVDIKKGADTKTVQAALEKLDIPTRVRGKARTSKAQEKKVVVKKESKDSKKNK